MNSILITGCNRGLGLGLVKAFLSLPKPPNHIIATCRDIEKAEVKIFFLFNKTFPNKKKLFNFSRNLNESLNRIQMFTFLKLVCLLKQNN